MDALLHRRITIAKYWATTRISILDGQERYEDSYAITEEFREWITCVEEHPDQLEDSVLKFPEAITLQAEEQTSDLDEMLEI